MKSRLALLISLSLFAHIPAAHAGWTLDGVPISTTVGASSNSVCVPDGSGGAIILWPDDRNGLDMDVYAQRVDANGVLLWAANGVPVCTASGNQDELAAISDGAGGVIVTWADERNGSNNDIYAQRINATGTPLWAANGALMCGSTGEQLIPSIASDEAGGAVMAWQDTRAGASYDIFAQRVNSAGVAQWAGNGVAVCQAANNQTRPSVVSDGTGGAIISFDDARSGADIYAQRLNSVGTARWTVNGVPVCTAVNEQSLNRAVSDGVGGAIIAWEDKRLGATRDIYAERINGSFGTPVWQIDGVPVVIAADEQATPSIVADGSGGAIVAWQDVRNGSDTDIYTQKINSLGAVAWTLDGVGVCTAVGDQYFATAQTDGAGGVVIAWQDERSGDDIYVQRISTDGAPLWQADGSPLCRASGAQSVPSCATDGAGGVIVAWSDERTGTSHPYAQRAELRYGYWGRPEPTITSASDNPNDQGGKVIVRWAASQRDVYYNPGISSYSVWRATDVVAAQSAIAGGVRVIRDAALIPRDARGPIILETPSANGPAYWEWIATLPALYQATYSYTAPTRQDSSIAGPAPNYFKVIASDYDTPFAHAWESGVASASSVDNLAPPAPIQLTGDRVGSGDVLLVWTSGGTAPDFDHYAIYRSGATDVQPIPGDFLTLSDDPSLDDAGAPAGALHYLVTAVDTHGNQSPPSNAIGIFDVTGVGDTPPAIAALTVRTNYPNPFTGSTALSVGLPAPSDIDVDIYDVAGQRVSTMHVRGAAAGWQSVAFDGRDDAGRPLASGVYFYRVHANGTTVTNKMVIAR